MILFHLSQDKIKYNKTPPLCSASEKVIFSQAFSLGYQTFFKWNQAVNSCENH